MVKPVVRGIVNGLILVLLKVLFVVDCGALKKIPPQGPAILVSNHTTNFEGPIYYVLLRARKVTALGKKELWENPFTRFLMKVWDIIPLNRGGPDREAFRRARQALDQGAFLGIAPEGTRSMSGELQKGRPGAAMLAVEARVPIIPMVQWGVQDLFRNIRRFRRTPIHVAVGEPFTIRVPHDRKLSAGELRQVTDEIMYQMALLMPEDYRGYYRDLSGMTEDFILRGSSAEEGPALPGERQEPHGQGASAEEAEPPREI